MFTFQRQIQDWMLTQLSTTIVQDLAIAGVNLTNSSKLGYNLHVK